MLRTLVIATCLACQSTLLAAGDSGRGLDLVLRGRRGRRQSEFDDPIETDRHDFTQSSRTVGKQAVQFEYGYSYFYNDDDGDVESTHAFPELAVRYGLTENVEVKVRWNYVSRFGEYEDLGGAEDLRLTLKLALLEQDRLIPETALQVRGSVPTGGTDWTTNSANPAINLIYTWELCEEVSLSGSTGATANGLGDVSLYDAQLDDNLTVWHQSAALGLSVSDRNEVYFEWFGNWSNGLADEYVQHYFNIGVDHLLTKDLVVDFRIGKGLTDDSEDMFAGLGGSARF